MHYKSDFPNESGWNFYRRWLLLVFMVAGVTSNCGFPVLIFCSHVQWMIWAISITLLCNCYSVCILLNKLSLIMIYFLIINTCYFCGIWCCDDANLTSCTSKNHLKYGWDQKTKPEYIVESYSFIKINCCFPKRVNSCLLSSSSFDPLSQLYFSMRL